jgi:DNA polymerase I-like protein with 3'-5' exonuclease and polymerase domains
MLIARSNSKLIGPATSEGFERLNLEERILAVDTETTGLDNRGTKGIDREQEPARPFFCSLCDADGNIAWIRWYVDPTTRKVVFRKTKESEILRNWLLDEEVTKVFANAPFDARMLKELGFVIRGEVIDAQLAAHVVKPDLFTYALKPLCKNLIGFDDGDEELLDKSAQKARAAVKSARRRVATEKEKAGDRMLAKYAINSSDEDQAYKADFWLADHKLLADYGGKDALRTMSLWIALREIMDEDMEKPNAESSRMWEAFRLEQELQPIVMKMEDRGIAVDMNKCKELREFYTDIHKTAAKGIIQETHADFNPASNPQMQIEFFVNRKHRPTRWVTKKRAKEPTPCQHCKGEGCEVCWETGHNPQCNSDFLAQIGVKRELGLDGEDVLTPNDLLAYHILRMKAAKSMRDFADSYLKLAVAHGDGYAIHPHYRQAEAATLRFSCSNPNLQNVADDDSGKKKIDVPYRPRECFVPRKNHVILAPDYSQIEVWLLMLRSGDPTLRAMLSAGGDLHGRIASSLWSKDFDLDGALADKKKKPTELSKHALNNLKTYVNRRKRSKNIQFCKIYGGGAAKIGFMIGCSVDDAKKFISDWENLFSEVANYMERKVHEAKMTGFSENAYGYRYPVSRGFEYVAVNYDIQGSAAMLIKRAMVKTFKDTCAQFPGLVDLLLTIHDELLVEVSKEVDWMSAAKVIESAMQADWKLLKNPIPFPVGMKLIETSWAQAKEVKL